MQSWYIDLMIAILFSSQKRQYIATTTMMI